MATIKIEDLNVSTSIVYLNTDEITDIKGGCPVCILLLGVAAGYAFDRWVNS